MLYSASIEFDTLLKDHSTAIVQDAGVTILGTVPSLVKTWKNTQCMEGLDWTKIK